METIYVSSTSKHKIAACEYAFAKIDDKTISIMGYSAPSGVSDQPHENSEIELGCLQRLNGVLGKYPDSFIVSIENGLVLEGNTYYDIACIMVHIPGNGISTVWSEKVAFPYEPCRKSRMHNQTKTAGEIMAENGIVSDHADPHVDLCGKPRAVILGEALYSLIQKTWTRL